MATDPKEFKHWQSRNFLVQAWKFGCLLCFVHFLNIVGRELYVAVFSLAPVVTYLVDIVRILYCLADFLGFLTNA